MTMSWREGACQWGTIFLIFPSIFLRPTTITIHRWGAVCSVSGRTTPPYSIRVAQKSKMTKLNASRGNTFFMQQVRTTPPYSIRVAQNYRYFATKKSEKNMSTTDAKIELSFEPELNFCNFLGGSKMSLQKLSERQHDLNIFPKTRQDFTTKSQKFKVSKFSRELALTCRWNNAKSFPD